MNNSNFSSGQDAVDPNCTQISPHSSPLVHETDECSDAQKTTETVRDEEISPDVGSVLRGEHGDICAKFLNVELEVPSLDAQQRGALLNADEDKVDKFKSTAELTADETFEDKVGVGDGIDVEASSTKGSVETETKNIEKRNDSDNLDNASHDQKNDPTVPLLKVLFNSMDGRATNDIQNAVLSDPVSVFEKGRFFWSSGQYVRKMLVLYEKPHYLLVIARRPKNAVEVRRIMETSGDSCMELNDLNDIDLIKSFCIAEKLIDLKICKLRLSSLTTPTSKLLLDKSDGELSVSGNMDSQARTCFEVITPKENLLMSFESDGLLNSFDSGGDVKYFQSVCEITKRWENGISRAIIEAHDGSNNVNDGDMAWRHQLILGTLHSHIVTGNYDLLQQVLAGKGSPDSPSAHINERDDAGFTALHYACLRRSHKAVSILLAAGADCSIPTIKGGKSPCHLCCEQLDDESLSIILSSSKPKRADPNTLDEFHNTPMYVALIMGKSPVGGRNPMKCLRTLEAWGGQIMLQDSDENRSEKHPIYILSSKCDSDGLKVAFHFFQFRFPFLGDPLDGYGRSLSAIYCYPIHVILISLRMKLNEVRSGENADTLHKNYVDAVKRSLQCLLDLGFEPNERIDATNPNPGIINEMAGCTPLQILVAVALDILDNRVNGSYGMLDKDMAMVCECVRSAATLLVSKGARVWIDPPPEMRPNRELTGRCLPVTTFRNLESTEYNLEKQKNAMEILGGLDHLAALQVEWQQNKFVKSCGQKFLQGKGHSHQIPDCICPGGNDQKSCAICWKSFGRIRNRKHVCRASRRYICEECSNNFVLVDGDKRRVSDGQFNLAKIDVEKSKEEDRLKEIRKRNERKMRIQKAEARRLHNRLQDTTRNEMQAKEDLFGNVGKAVRNFLYDDDLEDAQSRQRSTVDAAGVAGAVNSLNETKNAFIERGEKLNNLCEKTDALKNASKDFAKMAKQLADSQDKGIFGW